MKVLTCRQCSYDKPLCDFYKTRREPPVCMHCCNGRRPRPSNHPAVNGNGKAPSSGKSKKERKAPLRRIVNEQQMKIEEMRHRISELESMVKWLQEREERHDRL